jgi:hypothetical protein
VDFVTASFSNGHTSVQYWLVFYKVFVSGYWTSNFEAACRCFNWGSNLTWDSYADSCTDVLIENCFISTGDDAIAVKSGMDAAGVAYGKPTRNVIVRNLVVGRTHALSIGSEMSGGVANVLFQVTLLPSSGRKAFLLIIARHRRGDLAYWKAE